MTRPMLLALAAAALLAAGCGDDGENGGSGAMKDDATAESNGSIDESGAREAEPASAVAAMSAKRKGAVVKVVSSQFGRVIADRKGEALYLFDKEQAKKSECYGECAAVWPPVLTKGKPRAGKGAKAGKLGTTRRRDGKLQVTYAGHPLYYYVDDEPGTILCHDVPEFGGTWLVVKPSGVAAS